MLNDATTNDFILNNKINNKLCFINSTHQKNSSLFNSLLKIAANVK